jgi:hypothetical protein
MKNYKYMCVYKVKIYLFDKKAGVKKTPAFKKITRFSAYFSIPISSTSKISAEKGLIAPWF